MVDIYKKRLIEKKYNTYFLCVGDKDYNITKELYEILEKQYNNDHKYRQ